MQSAKLVFSDNSVEEVLNKMVNASNFYLDGNSEVAQGIVFPQDKLNKKNWKMLDNSDLKVGCGIYVINQSELKLLNVNENEQSIIKPYYTTGELSRYYRVDNNKHWVIYTNSLFSDEQKMQCFPNIKKHLDKFRLIFTSDNKPYGLHRARKQYFFVGEKIIVARKCVQPTFTYTDFDAYVSATFYVIKTSRLSQKFLTGVLNSKLIAFWLKHKGKMQGNNYQIDKEPLLELPLILPSVEIQNSIACLVSDIISIIKTNDNISEHLLSKKDNIERQIDQTVYKLYNLTDEEISIVENIH